LKPRYVKNCNDSQWEDAFLVTKIVGKSAIRFWSVVMGMSSMRSLYRGFPACGMRSKRPKKLREAYRKRGE